MRFPIWVAAAGAALLLFSCASPPASTGHHEIDAGRETFRRVCVACHGAEGKGGSAPALTEVLETFPSCDDQVYWITLGSDRWSKEEGPTYGATGKPITAVMPSFEPTLSEQQIRQVAAYERWVAGGQELEAAVSDCGLAPGG